MKYNNNNSIMAHPPFKSTIYFGEIEFNKRKTFYEKITYIFVHVNQSISIFIESTFTVLHENMKQQVPETRFGECNLIAYISLLINFNWFLKLFRFDIQQ